MNERIQELRKALGLSRAAFGSRIGISGDSVNNLERGRAEIKEPIIKLICSEYNVDYDWLKYGTGDMLVKEDIATQAKIDYIMSGEDSFAKTLFTKFANLSEEEWVLLEKFIDSLIEKGK